MKKLVFFSLLALMTVVFTGCVYHENHEGEPCHFNKKTIDLVVNQNNWSFDNSAQMYYCHFDVPELTSNVYNYGEVSIHHEYNHNTPNAYQVALPETKYIAVEINDNPYYYQEHIDYAIGVQFVEIFITISDFFYEDYTPESMNFRMQLTY